MDANTRTRIRHIFLSPRPHFPLNTVAELLEMSIDELKVEIKDGGIVAVSTAVGVRVTREEMVAAAMGRWETAVIEKALGREASRVLPEAIRLVELRARVPRIRKRRCGIWRGRSWRRRCRRWPSRCSLRAGDRGSRRSVGNLHSRSSLCRVKIRHSPKAVDPSPPESKVLGTKGLSGAGPS
jgi:hypothetical protein